MLSYGFRAMIGLAGLAGVLAVTSLAQATEITDAGQCSKAVEDAKKAYAEYEGLGPKAQVAFAEIVALAEARCAESEFAKAEQLLQIARGMVATE